MKTKIEKTVKTISLNRIIELKTNVDVNVTVIVFQQTLIDRLLQIDCKRTKNKQTNDICTMIKKKQNESLDDATQIHQRQRKKNNKTQRKINNRLLLLITVIDDTIAIDETLMLLNCYVQ